MVILMSELYFIMYNYITNYRLLQEYNVNFPLGAQKVNIL